LAGRNPYLRVAEQVAELTYQYFRDVPLYRSSGDWRLLCHPGPEVGYPHGPIYRSGNTGFDCHLRHFIIQDDFLQAASDSPEWGVGNGWSEYYYADERPLQGYPGELSASWERIAPGDDPGIVPAIEVAPARARPTHWPWLQPIAQVLPDPEPLPYRQRLALRASPAVEAGFDYPPLPPEGPALPPPIQRPPARSEKERKLSAEGALGRALVAAKAAINSVTETEDVLDAFYGALPKKRRWKRVSPAGKAWTVYRYFGELDWNKVHQNLVNNEVQDQLIGRAHNATMKNLRAAGYSFSHGIGLGPAM
jgi:hypothetical protein